MSRPNRQNIYLPDHLRDYVADAPSLSGRICTVLDRYREALRRTRIEEQFSEAERRAVLKACAGWLADPAATVFGGIELELRDAEAPAELIAKIARMTPWEQVAMVEWLEERR